MLILARSLRYLLSGGRISVENLMHLPVYGSDKNLVTASKRIDGFELVVKQQ